MARKPVYSGKTKVVGLYERENADGSTIYEYRGRLDGQVTTRRLEAGTKLAAIREVRAIQAGAKPVAAGTVTLDELAADFVTHLRARVDHRDESKRRSARTVDLYEQRLRDHVLPKLGRRSVDSITVADVRQIVDSLSAKSPSTVSGVLTCFSALMRFARRDDLIEVNPVRQLDREDRPVARRESEPRYLAAPEIEALLSELSPSFRGVAAACAYAGLRVSESLALKWRDIDFTENTITISGQLGKDGRLVPLKTPASCATLPLLPRLREELLAVRGQGGSRGFSRIAADALVFQTSRGRPQSRRNAARAVRAAGDACGLNGGDREPVGLHDLRHSLVAAALAAGLTLPEVAKLARHANPRVTMQVYAGMTEGSESSAAAKLAEAGFGS